MTPFQSRLVFTLGAGQTSEENFVKSFPFEIGSAVAYLRSELAEATAKRDKVQLEAVVILAYHFSKLANIADILRKLSFEDWHNQHENIAMAFQKLKDPLAVDSIYHMATAAYPYLEFDDNYALAVKCIWALFAIDTAESREKLQLLKHSANPIIASNAGERLQRLSSAKH